MMVKVRIPATSANMGPGFDSMGIALNLYNYVTAEETQTGKLEIEIAEGSLGDGLPTDEENLVYKAMMKVFEAVGHKFSGLKLILENRIMTTRGLGSSSAGIVGGILAADRLCGGKLSPDEMLFLGAEMEGHPDNVAPALLGGFTVNVMSKHSVRYVKTELDPEKLRFAALVPDFYLPTKKAREILPESVPLVDAVYNEGRSALLAASLISGKYENIRTAVGDRLHQNHRKRLIPNMETLFDLCYQKGALGVYLSGAGPTLIAIVPGGNKRFACEVGGILLKDNRLSGWKLYDLCPDNEGARIIEEAPSEI